MRKLKRFKYMVLVVTLFSIALLYQNCSKNSFHEDVGIYVVDPLVCEVGQPSSETQLYPTPCLTAPNFLNLSAPGFISFNIQGATLDLLADDQVNGMPSDTRLYIEVATYQHSDTVIVKYSDTGGKTTDVLNLCQISTYPGADSFTGMTYRPYSDSILQFMTKVVPAGTKKITLDMSQALSANYVAIWNLSSFSNALAQIHAGTLHPQVISDNTYPLCAHPTDGDCRSPGAIFYQANPPTLYNDQTDGSTHYYDPLSTRPNCGHI